MKASKGFIKDFYTTQALIGNNKDALALLPDFDRDKALKAIREDYAVQTAVSKLVDKTLENGYELYPEDNKSNFDEFNQLVVKKARFNKQIRSWLYQLYGYQNAFIEIVKDGNNKLKELHILETTTTEPLVDEHGEVLGYIQRIPNMGNNAPTWNPDEVTHIKLNYMTTNMWSDIEIKSIYTSVLIKKYILAYFGWKYGTNQLRPLYLIKDATEDAVKDFLAYWKKVQIDITKPLVFEGDLEKIMMAEATEETPLLKVLDSMDENIYSAFHVPPIASNETGQSNRSSADKQEQMMAVRIRAVQNVIEEAVKYDLFPKIGFPKINFKFNPPLMLDVSKAIETAERMKNMGISIDVIEDYLRTNVFYDKKKIFDKDIIKAEKEGLKPTKKSEDMYPSRKRKPQDETSKNIGTGENSTTREDQLVAKGLSFFNDTSIDTTRFSKYPYTY